MKKQNIIRKTLALLLAIGLTLSLAACTGGETGSGDGKTYKIGLCNYVDDASLNHIVENIQSRFM